MDYNECHLQNEEYGILLKLWKLIPQISLSLRKDQILLKIFLQLGIEPQTLHFNIMLTWSNKVPSLPILLKSCITSYPVNCRYSFIQIVSIFYQFCSFRFIYLFISGSEVTYSIIQRWCQYSAYVYQIWSCLWQL